MTQLLDFLRPAPAGGVSTEQFEDFGSILRWRATQHGDRGALAFLGDGESATEVVTYAELDRRARAVAAELQRRGLRGERALLLFPPGLDFIAAFFGCLYSGTIAVPAPPPRARRQQRVESMLADSGAQICLATQSLLRQSRAALDSIVPLTELPMLATDEIHLEKSDDWNQDWSNKDDIAFLQYTSGSTGVAKGVMVSHGNLLHNSASIAEAFCCSDDDVAISWLPHFHDMGLIGGILQPIYSGRPAILAPPISIIEKPVRWLQAITRYDVTISGGPNFAYEACLRKVTDAELDLLDLSRWRLAFTGSETIRPETLASFAERFAACGFRPETFYPCYGLAEATLLATAGSPEQRPVVRKLDTAALESNRVVDASGDDSSKAGGFVSCGRPLPRHNAVIVDPHKLTPCHQDQIGEIWLSGPSIAKGYWNRTEETQRVFRAALANGNGTPHNGHGTYLRTGDLGFVHDGEIYVTGRLKDLIIIRGANHYPQDIERTVEGCHPSIRSNGAAAFSTPGTATEHLALVLEIERPTAIDQIEDLFTVVRRAVADVHELAVSAITVLKPGHLPRTSSGKTQRKACRAAFLNETLSEVLAQWRSPLDAADEELAGPDEEASHGNDEADRENVPVVTAPLQTDSVPLDSSNGARTLPTTPGTDSQATAKTPLLPQPRASAEENKSAGEPLAIVGMSCRFPGCDNVRSFLNLLRAGREGITEIPPERWDVDAHYDPDPEAPGKMITRWGGFLKDIEQFDASLFGVTPREASRMDPQQRLLVELCWELMENAGVAADQIADSVTGCFIGIGGTDYSTLQLQYENHLEGIDAYTGTGNAHSLAANRLSYLFDMRGPSLAVDTACSSSLVALHLAAESLRSGQCDAAVVGGVNLILSPEVTIAFSKARMLSPDGRCMAFDARANGYVRGEGCGLVLIKRLKDARAAGDDILAILRGTACNQDGRTTGVSAPNVDAQEAVIRAALDDAGLHSHDVGYIEAHGTGTPIGDPIEVEALRRVFREADPAAEAPQPDPCLFGSVKGNIGHLETASGVAGLIKVLLMLQHGEVYRQVNWESMNPYIKLDGSRLKLAESAEKWQPANGRRIAGLNSFGFGGTNAHVILERPAETRESPHPDRSRPKSAKPDRPRHMLALSAHRPSALKKLALSYGKLLARTSNQQLPDVCFSAGTTRASLPHRLVVHAATSYEMAESLQAYASAESAADMVTGHARRRKQGSLAFLCTGQGAQYAGMGRQLFDAEPLFRRSIQQCDELLRPLLDVALIDVLYHDVDPSRVDHTAYTQPALFAVEWSLAQLWTSWGIRPDALLGHSIGEYVAAALAGVFTWQDGLRLIAERARLMQSLPTDGTMAVLLASAADVEPLVQDHPDDISIAAWNGPNTVVISGRADAIQRVLEEAETAELPCRMLNVSHAFHSPLMEPILDEFEAFAKGFQYQPPQIPLVSNVTGKVFDEAEAPDAAYWRRHIRSAVQFEQGMQALAEFGCDRFLEVGPNPTLTNMGKTCLPAGSATWFASLRRDCDDWQQMLQNLGSMYCHGLAIDWRGFDRHYQRRRVSLPGYPFERERFWMAPEGEAAPIAVRQKDPHAHPLLGTALSSPMETKQYESLVDQRHLRYLADHRVQGSVLVPAAAYLETALAAARASVEDSRRASATLTIENVVFQQPLFLADDSAAACLQLVELPEAGGHVTFQIFSRDARQETGWTLNVRGTRAARPAADDEPPVTVDLQSLRGRCPTEIPVESFYSELAARGLQYGPQFQGVTELARGDGEAVGRIDAPEKIRRQLEKYCLHPALLDASFHVLAAAMPAEADTGETYLPVAVDRLVFHRAPGESFFVHATWNDLEQDSDSDGTSGDISGNCVLLDDAGRPAVEVRGLRLKRLAAPGDKKTGSRNWQDWLYQVVWKGVEALETIEPEATLPEHLAGGLWLILSDRGGVGDGLADKFARHDIPHLIVTHAAVAKQLSENHVQGNFDGADDVWKVIDAAIGNQGPIRGVVHLWSLDIDQSGDAADHLNRARELGVQSCADVIKHLASNPSGQRPSLWGVTRGSQVINQEPLAVAPSQAPLWALLRVAVREHRDLRTSVLDLCPHTPVDVVDDLWREIWHQGYEDQLALRGGTRWVQRLERCDRDEFAEPGAGKTAQVDSLLRGDRPFRLEVADAGTIDSLQVRPTRRRQLDADQVEIEVAATGLNFSDVLKALGLYPGITDAVVPLGIECAGVVTAVGRDVTSVQPGDEVMALAPYSFGRYAVTVDYGVVRKPAEISFEDAAAMPVAYITAHYALATLGHIGQGERVLIHAAAGGVGQAAIRIAQAAGAEIFATAGTPEKRAYLQEQGVDHVLDSRSLDFADQIMDITAGEGIDLVLNSLAGEAIPKSLSLLRAYGRFLEIGKIDIYQNRMLGLAPFRNNLSYFAIDMDRLFRERPDVIRQLLGELKSKFDSDAYGPLPVTIFSMREVTEAFRYMAQRRNTGKIVVRMNEGDAPCDESEDSTSCAERIGEQRTYLITGGLGQLGLAVAEHLAAGGATHLVLVGRSEPGEEAQAVIDRLRDAGIHVQIEQTDVTSQQSVCGLFATIAETMPALTGVVHAAGVLDDALLLQLTPDQLARVMAPKVQGAWNLHAATRGLDLDCFVMFSSVASVLGAEGQSNYAAGNAFLDALAQLRHHQGLPALSINWGPWQGAGMVGTVERERGLQRRGVFALPPDTALLAFDRLLKQPRPQVMVANIDWARALRHDTDQHPPLVSELAAQEGVTTDAGGDAALLENLRAATPAEAHSMLTAHFVQTLARVISQDPNRIDPTEPIRTLGLDSLMAIELKNAVETSMRINIPMASLFQDPSIEQLASIAYEIWSRPKGQPATHDTEASTPAKTEPTEEADPAATG